jgi:phage protein D
MKSYPIRIPQWILTYQGTNITADISSMALEIVYSDFLENDAGEIAITLEDAERLWQGPWYPQQGDLVSLAVGYHGEELLPCGDFQVDQLELDGPPDVFHLRCLSAYVVPAMRTANYVAYEGQSLTGIAAIIAGKYGLTLIAAADSPDIGFQRVTQAGETDLSFLRRLAREHGYGFNVRGDTLVFYAYASLEAQPPVASIQRSDVIRFHFSNKTHRVYQAAHVAYQHAAARDLIAQTSEASPPPITSDSLKLNRRCENNQQALFKAKGALHAANKSQVTAEIVLSGMTILSAGNNIEMSGFGVNDGIYLIEAARHRLGRNGGAVPAGYSTEIETRRLALPA